jgi:hypothetical protein
MAENIMVEKITQQINDDFFKKENKYFSELVETAKNNKNIRISCLIEASKIKPSAVVLKNSDLEVYRNLIDEEVYSHVVSRLNDMIHKIRSHIHKKEYDKAKIYIKDMHVLGDFIKSKNIRFDFEFYTKIDNFFNKKETKNIKLFPFYK